MAGFFMQQVYELCPLLPGPSSIVSTMNILLGCGSLMLDYIVSWPEYGFMDVVILIINHSFFITLKYILHMTGRIKAGNSLFGFGHVLPEYGHEQSL